MKKMLPALLMFAILIYALPLVGLLTAPKNSTKPATDSTSKNQALSIAPPPFSAPDTQHSESPLLILDEGTNTVLTVPMRDYVLGAVAAEMPMTYPDEALKAQAVAAHSYALAVKAAHNPADAALQGAYFKANPAQRFGFVTQDVMRVMWGEKYEENYNRLSALVNNVISEVLLYDGRTALACYCAINNGSTEDAANVWGGSVPYLVRVDSPLDKTSPDYEVTLSFTPQEIYESLSVDFAGVDLTGQPDTWFTSFDRSDAGYVTQVHFKNTAVSGADFRKSLALRSSDFTIAYADGAFQITTRGYGHGVGLSQYGASVLALAGKNYREILAQYFPGTVLGQPA